MIANMAATLDLVSGGRLILGLGCGWHEPEYRAFGFPFDRRVSRFAEAVEIVVRLLDGERLTFRGDYYEVEDAALAPAPARRIPVLVASKQERMNGLTARWGDMWNTAWFRRPDDRFDERRALRAGARGAGKTGRRRPADGRHPRRGGGLSRGHRRRPQRVAYGGHRSRDRERRAAHHPLGRTARGRGGAVQGSRAN